VAVTDLAAGVAAGLAAAFFSALSYLVSRHHGVRQRAIGRRGSALRLLVLAHQIMAAVCIPLALAAWPPGVPFTRPLALALAGSVGFYLLGQAAIFAALGRAEASRVSPLLGLKIVMLAGLVTFVLGQPLDGRQWLAVGLCVAAAAALQAGGGAIPPGPLALVLAAAFAFAVADLTIVAAIDALVAAATAAAAPVGRLHAAGLAMTLTYAVCGGLFLPLVPRVRPFSRDDRTAALQYAAAWMASMVALYVCFAFVGAVFGTILQSTRGLVSVVLGAVLAHRGWNELEQRVDREALLRRVAAATFMTAAIAVYCLDLSAGGRGGPPARDRGATPPAPPPVGAATPSPPTAPILSGTSG
jgi:hypothetical protein